MGFPLNIDKYTEIIAELRLGGDEQNISGTEFK